MYCFPAKGHVSRRRPDGAVRHVDAGLPRARMLGRPRAGQADKPVSPELAAMAEVGSVSIDTWNVGILWALSVPACFGDVGSSLSQPTGSMQPPFCSRGGRCILQLLGSFCSTEFMSPAPVGWRGSLGSPLARPLFFSASSSSRSLRPCPRNLPRSSRTTSARPCASPCAGGS